MLFPEIKKFLAQLFREAGFSEAETEERVKSTEETLKLFLLARLLQLIPKSQKSPLKKAFSQVRNFSDFQELVVKQIHDSVSEDQFFKLYAEELNKILDRLLEPFRRQYTPAQLLRLKDLATKYNIKVSS